MRLVCAFLGLCLALFLALPACTPQPSAQAGLASAGANATAEQAALDHPKGDNQDAGDNSPSPSRGGGFSPSHGSGPGPHK